MGQDNCNPEPGDLIQIYRPVYQHWALYMGDGYVVHLTSVEKGEELTSKFNIRAKVKKELLKDVVEEDKWRVNNKYGRSRKPRPVKEIIRRAEESIDKEVPYDVITRNCEHFVTELRFGKAFSDQVRILLAAAAGAVTAIFSVLLGVALYKKKSK